MNNPLEKTVSFQDSATSSISKEMSISHVLNEIKTGKYSNQINKLRELLRDNRIDNYNTEKKKLPAVTFCGTFNGIRKREFIKEYNQILVIDIDKLDEQEFERVKSIVESEEFVFASWISPSQNGIKGLISLSFKSDFNSTDIDMIDIRHKIAFKQIQNYYSEKYDINIDSSGSDTTRLCFFSLDPKLKIKNDYKQFEIEEIEFQLPNKIKTKERTSPNISIGRRDLMFNPKNKNRRNNRVEMHLIIKYLSKRNLSITNSYSDWYKVAFAIANSFTYDIGEKYFLRLSKLDINKFDEQKCRILLMYCYENSKGKFNFGTILYLAIKKGYIYKNSKRGVVLKMAATSS